MFLRGLLGIVFMVLASPALSQTWLTVTTASHHFDRNDYEEQNWGLGLEHSLSEQWRVTAGIYRNSFSKTSIYVGGVYSPFAFGPAAVGVMGGLFTGYGDHLQPVLAPVLSLEGRRLGANLLYVPPYGDHRGLVALQLKWKLD